MSTLFDTSASWKKLQGAFGHSSGFEDPGFDDSGWTTSTGPFGSTGACSYSYATLWNTSTDLCLRRNVTIPADTLSLVLTFGVDNDAKVYWDGVLIRDVTHTGCATATDFSVTVVAPTSGSHVIAVRAHDYGAVTYFAMRGDTTSSDVTPVADFSGTPLVGSTPHTVAFTDLSTNAPTSWAWDFGDSDTDTVQFPTHEYVTAGTYTVELVATNAGGSDTETKVAYVVVRDPEPGAW